MRIIKNKIFIGISIAVLVLSCLALGIFFYQKNSLRAEVIPVENLKESWFGNEVYSQGIVTNDHSQIIRLTSSNVVKEVFVEEGQEVKVGDKLIELDIEAAEIEKKIKELEVENIKNQIAIKENELNKWRNTVPGSNDTEAPNQSLGPEKEGKAYKYITPASTPYNVVEADGSIEKPYRYLCTPEAFVTAEALNELANKKHFSVYEIRKNGEVSGELIASWEVNGMQLIAFDSGTYWSVSNRQQVFPFDSEENYTTTYSAEEIQKNIKECEKTIKDLNLSMRKASLEFETLKAKDQGGVILATVDGVVKNLKSIDEISSLETEQTPFLEVSGSKGLYVTGALSELLLDKVEVGQEVNVSSWESGATTVGKITLIKNHPTKDSNAYGANANPNVSYYPYTAYIEDSTSLRNGEYVDLNMKISEGSSEDIIYLPNAYIRSENGKFYVYKEDENKRLKKTFVKTGSTAFGQSTEIKSGLSLDDKIAFPYGKTAKNGVRTVDANN